jgi:hypothetical protein
MSPAEKKKSGFYTPRDVQVFAQALRDVCKREGINCTLGLFSLEHKDKDACFFDWGHLNARGCRLFAEAVYRDLTNQVEQICSNRAAGSRHVTGERAAARGEARGPTHE